MAELGRQTPTRSVVLPYEKTKGAQAVKLYNLTGHKAQEWQELMLYDIMSVGADGLCRGAMARARSSSCASSGASSLASTYP